MVWATAKLFSTQETKKEEQGAFVFNQSELKVAAVKGSS